MSAYKRKPRPLTVDQAAEYFNVSAYTIRLWCRDGTLEGVKPPGTKAWRIPPEAIEKLVQIKYGD